jgi:putative DNA methylase
MPRWADMFSPRQLLALGALVEELQLLRPQVIQQEGEDVGEAVVHLLAMALDKLANWNAMLASWNAPWGSLRSVFDRHDYAFKSTFAEMAACVAGSGMAWAVESVMDAYEKLSALPKAPNAQPVTITQGSATNLMALEDRSIIAVVVDPPYADNVQYSELADFFYVWMKRTQGHRRPEWFSTYLCDHDQEAVVNISRNRDVGDPKVAEARIKANAFYQNLMTDTFREAHRVLRDDGVLTVMFTHKQQSAWAALFDSLIDAGFTITATFPVQTESQNSLHQADKNAAQSTVILVARKRDPGAGMRYYDDAMQEEMRLVAQSAAARLKGEGLNAVDQLVGAFGPTMEVFSRYDEVRQDTGEKVSVADAIQTAANAVAEWRVEQLAQRGLEGVDADSRFFLLCWDVLGAAEFRFNEASMLGKAVSIDVTRMKETGLVFSSGDKVNMLPAAARRREKPVKSQVEQLALLDGGGRKRASVSRKVHPNDEYFTSAIDMCHALALRFADGQTEQNGIANAKTLANQMGWTAGSPCAKLMEALVTVAPEGVRFPGTGKKTAADAFPEFRAWHTLLRPLFGIQPPEWKAAVEQQPALPNVNAEDAEDPDDGE